MPKTTPAYCGINCDKCPVLIATSKDDDALRQKTAKEWASLYADIYTNEAMKAMKKQ
jgi:hypothetical protein